jgi:hypothetical protein
MARRLVKIRFKLDPVDWHGHGFETVWAEPSARDATLFQIANSPFFATGINYRDVVAADPSNVERMFDFSRVVERSGHSTYMVLVKDDEPRFAASWANLHRQGCTYESAHIELSIGHRLLLSVDVPPTAELHEVYQYLAKGEEDGVWRYQEGYAHAVAR